MEHRPEEEKKYVKLKSLPTGLKLSVCYHGDGSGRADRVTVEMGSAMVEVLGHVGEGFVAEPTLVKRVNSVSLPAGGQRRVLSRARRHGLAAGVRFVLPHLCIIRVISVVNPLPQSTHRYLATPECVRMWVCSDVAFLNIFPQSGHSYVPCSCTRV